ncbi:MAG: hypothetical protein ACJAVK_003236 [Akkermansiaceae bacterium]|jgi:hypothetical protein
MIPELQKLAKELEEPAHLVVWKRGDRFEVVAVKGDDFEDAFPLPMNVQSAAAEAEMILDTTTAARLEIEQMPEDFWESLVEVCYGEFLQVSILGRAGQKYLQVYHAVKAGEGHDLAPLEQLALTEGELLKVAKWIREHALFDHKKGAVIMEVLTRLC